MPTQTKTNRIASDTPDAIRAAAEARAMGHALGALFEGLLSVLVEKHSLTMSDVRDVFRVAFTMIDRMKAENKAHERMKAEIRALIGQMAKRHGIQIRQ